MLVVASERWHPGIVGIIASRLKDRYRRPAVAVAFDRLGRGTGSGRSLAGVDLGAALAVLGGLAPPVAAFLARDSSRRTVASRPAR